MRTYPEISVEQDPAGKLAEMVVNAKYEDFSPEMIEQAKKAVFDTLSVLLAGSSRECVPLAKECTALWSEGAGDGRILVYGDRAPAPLAAWVNGTMARCIDMGDVHESGGHITEWIVPAILSSLQLADRPISGKEFLAAYLACAEVIVRIHTCNALHGHNVGIPGEMGGPLAATMAVSKILGSDVEQMWNAMGITYSVHCLAEGQKYNEAAQTVRLQHGFGGNTAVMATMLGRGGFAGPKGIFLGAAGGALRYNPWDDVKPELLTEELGRRWLFDNGLSLKPYASCKFTHSVVYATISLMEEAQITCEQIEKIHCIISKGAAVVITPEAEKWNPKQTAEAIFSLPYSVAHAAMHGNVFLDAYTQEEINQPEKRELMSRITAEVDPSIESSFEGFTVKMTLKDGRTLTKTAEYTLGHPKNPMSWEDQIQKFWNCVPYAVVKFPQAQYESIIELCRHLEEMDDITKLRNAMLPQ